MTQRFKRGAVEHTYPLWLRMLTLACLLLVAGASTVDAVHIHGEWLPHHGAQVGAAAVGSQLPGEESCPLCVAMHSALPVVARLEPVRVVLLGSKMAQGVDRAPETMWHFAMYSRPPPVATL